MARKFSHSPGQASRIAAGFLVAVRFMVGALAILAFIGPVTMDEDAVEPLRLVDDGGTSSSDPPYTPGPSDGGSSSPSDGPSGTNGDGEDGGDGDGSSSSDSAAGLPVAAQAGISLAVLGLAALALLPGRRPPAHLR